ncbi:hypothetical protein [Fretibacter rubidus]|uniref:hypothetical protein n=1 Tax=Fretibacter rubidus TaxID=570162 RepID=UPI00352B4739
MQEFLTYSILILVIPIFIGKFILRASWQHIGITYAVLVAVYVLLIILMRADGGTWTEATGWPAVMFLFWGLPAFILIIIALKVKDLMG